MVAPPHTDHGLHNRGGITLAASSTEVLPGKSTESLPTKSIEQEKPVQLKRELGLFSAVNMNVGCMIGSGIFVSPSIALARSGSVALCLIIWVVCGLISMMGALAFAELSTVVPRSGAEYAYFLEAYGSLHKFWGPLPCFMCAWVHVFVLSPTSAAVIILTFSEYACQPFTHHMSDLTPETREMVKKIIAILGLAPDNEVPLLSLPTGLLTFINFMSVKLYIRMQNVFAICKLVVCIVVIASGVYFLCTGTTKNLSKGFEGSNTSPKNLALAFYGCLWSYGGCNILRSIVISLPLVTAIYVMMNVAYMTVLTVPEIIAAPAVAVVFGDRVLGVMNFIIPIGVALSTFGCALSGQFTVSRLCYVAATEGHIVEAFSYIHMRRLTPAPAVVLQGFLAFLFIVSGDITSLIAFASFLTWIFYGLAMVALMILRRTKKEENRTFKVPLFVPLLIITVSLFLFLVPIITDPSPRYFFALFLLALGFVIYIPLVYYKIRPHCMNKFTYFIQVLMEVVPSENTAD